MGYTVTLPTEVAQRLQGRAARAELFDKAGRPDVFALRNRAIEALTDAGDTVDEALQALILDQHDPDMALFIRACAATAIEVHPPRWPAFLSDRIDLDVLTLLKLHQRAEDKPSPSGTTLCLSAMASCELVVAFNGRVPTEAELMGWMTAHSEPAMRALFAALERARAAARPN